MLTLEVDSREFESNANQTGLQQFLFIKRGVNAEGKNVYLYQRAFAAGEHLGKITGYEVFIPNVKKAGTYPLPGGKTITYEQDFEEYPGASVFGKRAFFCVNLERAEIRFAELMAKGTPEPEEPEPVKEESEPKQRGRPKAERPAMKLPHGEFSVTELAEKNSVDYSVAALFAKEQLEANKIKKTRTERRAARGKETQLYAKI